ncbi:hypothetical protein BDV96DRAFT_567991 [Lophiotrema nucula]|uniref:SUR7/PalI family-domain-containing protein n=1 Tax=Lophiotrema nucula TaxID=690887 RepID=A0A6A5ZKW2_9PLEO|nr:hypothetical protein BDV96DRAFT_567991 [Lophiotrema nucula]
MTVSSSARLAVWLSLLLNAMVANASFWTITSSYELSLSSGRYYTYTSTRTIKTSVTPASAAVSTSTYDRTYYDLEEIYVFYPPDSVEESELEPEYVYGATTTTDVSSSSYTGTIFLMPVTYTAPSTCSSQFTFSTDEVVYVPTEVIDQIHPTSIVTDPPSTYATYIAPGYETWYLSEGAAPITTESEYYYTEYIASCSKPYDSSYYKPSSGGGGYSTCYGSLYGDSCTALKVWIIVVASIIPALFLLGFLESWIWFRRLMLGKGCLRFGTVSWICISLWVACFTRTQSARSQEDQKLLREQWNAMKGSTAFKLWWKYGFRHRYPEEILGKYDRNTVGIVRPNQPGIEQQQFGGPGPYSGPPGPPPPGYVHQNGAPMMQQPYPVYVDASKEGARFSEVPAPPPGQAWYMAAPNQTQPPNTVPVPAPYGTARSPPPGTQVSEVDSSHLSEAPSPATPYSGYVQPYMAGSPPPPQQYVGIPPRDPSISPDPPSNVSEVQGTQFSGVTPAQPGSPPPILNAPAPSAQQLADQSAPQPVQTHDNYPTSNNTHNAPPPHQS